MDGQNANWWFVEPEEVIKSRILIPQLILNWMFFF